MNPKKLRGLFMNAQREWDAIREDERTTGKRCATQGLSFVTDPAIARLVEAARSSSLSWQFPPSAWTRDREARFAH